MEGPFNIWLRPLKIHMVRAPDPKQKMSSENTACNIPSMEIPSHLNQSDFPPQHIISNKVGIIFGRWLSITYF